MDLLTIDLARIEPPSLRDGEATDSEGIAALAESIARHGLIHPISVCTMLDGGSADYEVAIGARRLHALRLLDNQSRGVPVRAQVLDIEPGAVMAENTCRSDMTVWEIGEAVAAMGDAPDAVVAAAAGIAPTQVPYARRIATLQPELAELVQAGRLSLPTTLAVVTLPASAQRGLVDTIVRDHWNTEAADMLAVDWIRGRCGNLRGTDLSTALWPMDEEWTDPVDPIRANACIRCPQNATAAPDLLGELNECHDVACYDARLHSVLEHRATSVDGPALEIAAHGEYPGADGPGRDARRHRHREAKAEALSVGGEGRGRQGALVQRHYHRRHRVELQRSEVQEAWRRRCIRRQPERGRSGEEAARESQGGRQAPVSGLGSLPRRDRRGDRARSVVVAADRRDAPGAHVSRHALQAAQGTRCRGPARATRGDGLAAASAPRRGGDALDACPDATRVRSVDSAG